MSRENNYSSNADNIGHSYKPITNTNIKTMNNMLNFLWVKIEEKFIKLSLAFRFFDEKCRSKVSYKDFVQGIEKLRVKLHKDDIKEIFTFLDADQDKFLNYQEFSKINRSSGVISSIPSPNHNGQTSSRDNTRISTRAKSNDFNRQKMDPDGKCIIHHLYSL